MFFYFIQGVALALPSTVAPSPLKVFLISQALENGWKRTLPAVLAPLITDGPIMVLVFLVLTRTPGWFLDTLRILGGLFILYLAWRILLMLKTGGPALKASEEAARQSLLKAVMINVFNPNPYILWGVVAGPIVIRGWQESFMTGLSFIIGFYAMFVIGLAGLVIIFATAGKIDPRMNKFMSLLAGAALVIFGLYQIAAGGAGLFSR